ncbi:MAG: lysophospholipid acyltransferase family protein [Bacteroidota bacterium]
MRLFKNIFHIFYRIWFYVLIALPIIILFPILIISISRESWYPFFFRLARLWARFILIGMGFYPVVKRMATYTKGESYMLVANHTSMTDIMLMLYVSKNSFVFVGKAELAKIPLFGFFYKRTCILVDRNNAKSRHAVFAEAQKRLNNGLSVCIFPEGGVPDDEEITLGEFKDGAFRLAIEHKIPLAPLTFHDNKKRFSYTFFSGGPGKMRVTAHPIIPTGILEIEDKRMLKLQVYDLILEELNNPSL